ncbi:MAG: hypothetical protein E6J36_01410 [Chloroflexi bacterium]|nr:MAG: hypothetical protein E6J36_01410 [Chloroflexota bacterium]TMC95535.1 MAG: hypothetical protein E6J22_03370 [Chloroflexota bacterium]
MRHLLVEDERDSPLVLHTICFYEQQIRSRVYEKLEACEGKEGRSIGYGRGKPAPTTDLFAIDVCRPQPVISSRNVSR